MLIAIASAVGCLGAIPYMLRTAIRTEDAPAEHIGRRASLLAADDVVAGVAAPDDRPCHGQTPRCLCNFAVTTSGTLCGFRLQNDMMRHSVAALPTCSTRDQ